MGDVCIKAGSYCPICRGIIGADCWHDAKQFHAGSGYLNQLLKAKERIDALEQKRDGWKWVPVEPTDEMIRATFAGMIMDQSVTNQIRRDAEMKRRIALAIAAAPEPQEVQE